jgi:hypothetical protein
MMANIFVLNEFINAQRAEVNARGEFKDPQ